MHQRDKRIQSHAVALSCLPIAQCMVSYEFLPPRANSWTEEDLNPDELTNPPMQICSDVGVALITRTTIRQIDAKRNDVGFFSFLFRSLAIRQFGVSRNTGDTGGKRKHALAGCKIANTEKLDISRWSPFTVDLRVTMARWSYGARCSWLGVAHL